jgi:hypothetical protein
MTDDGCVICGGDSLRDGAVFTQFFICRPCLDDYSKRHHGELVCEVCDCDFVRVV